MTLLGEIKCNALFPIDGNKNDSLSGIVPSYIWGEKVSCWRLKMKILFRAIIKEKNEVTNNNSKLKI